MRLDELRPASGAKKKRRRVGRGPGSGTGKTSGRGHKGAGQRAGSGGKRAYEGGQTPLVRRLPKRGFRAPGRVRVQIVNLAQLRRFEAGARVDRESLRASKAIASLKHPVKVLGQGEIDIALTVRVDRISQAARKKIEAAGGTVELVSGASAPAAAAEQA